MSDNPIENPIDNSAESSDAELSAAVEEALSEAEIVVDEIKSLTNDLQRLQAEYSNFRKRIERERVEWSERTVGTVLSEFLSILDDLDRAQQHGELEGGFKAVADQLVAVTKKLGLERFEEVNVPFDPNIHEALMHTTSSEVSETTATQILQPGYKFKERVIRPARVAVTDPE
jgi:molecular chaperone GrpE